MAGDHKCPVCSSTFTRPQHVARHMRSHTGDRPYKCVHCGDQFARSDLLSRHVNKCHASAKSSTNIQPARRKGHPQPGSSSAGVRGPAPQLVPAPGVRKVICDACGRSRSPAQCDSGLPCNKCFLRSTDCTYTEGRTCEHALPATASASTSTTPAPIIVPSMVPQLFPSQPDFNFTIPLYPQSLHHNPALMYTNDHASLPQSVPLYSNQQVSLHSIPQYTDASKTLDQVYLDQRFAEVPALLYPQPEQPQHVNRNHLQHPPQYAPDIVYDEVEQGSGLTHVFPPVQSFPQPQQPQQPREQGEQQQQPRQQQQQQHPKEMLAAPEGGFSSAFGRMSLEDPAVAAEMSKNNSFFPATTATPRKSGDMSPGRDSNITELRDFWKAFIRDNTPSEKGAGGGTSGSGTTSTPANGNGRSGRRTISKIASLPEIKTPSAIEHAGPQYSTTEEARQEHEYYHPSPPVQGEDLTSYQQAVLSRKTPTLTLMTPRRRNTRPTFKRLASQTLEPFESKSVKVSHPGMETLAMYESCGGADMVQESRGFDEGEILGEQ